MNTSPKAPAAPRGRPKTHDKQAVLETAMAAYWRADSAAVSVNAIAALAGVAKPSLYRDFGSEDGLTLAVLERYAEVILMDMPKLLATDLSFSAKLDAIAFFACEDSRMQAGCLFEKMCASRWRLGEQTRARIAQCEQNTLTQFTQFFRQGKASGEWSGNIAPELAASYLREQLGLALTQRAAGKSQVSIRQWLTLALSVLR